MRIIPVPYLSNTSDLLLQLQAAQGLIWYHDGLENKQCEWVSAWPSQEFKYAGDQTIEVTNYDGDHHVVQDDWFEFLKQRMPNIEPVKGIKFTGGLAGHLSYDLGLELLNISSSLSETPMPLAVVGLYHWCIYIDHANQTTSVVIQTSCPVPVEETVDKLTQSLIDNAHSTQQPLARKTLQNEWACLMTQAHYQNSFNAIKKYIIEGDVYQVNLTRQWQNTRNGVDDLSLYLSLYDDMPAPFSVFQRSISHSLLSVSPERFIQIKDGKILTQPIKGTRPRSSNKTQDAQYQSDLANSEKDQAENLMIVDLLRNDLSRNAVPGSVKVDQLFEVQSFKNVHHLVSSISAELAPDKHPLDVMRDAFPGGSITGAPKKRAMEVIDELETVRRGNYCGCSFYLGANGYLDSNILIRTATLTSDNITCSGGGGIVFDSELESEYSESEVKVAKILNALAPKKAIDSKS